MLHAIYFGKARRLKIEGLEPAPRWRDIFHSNEDLLTATVFERLACLSDAVFRQLIAFMTGESGGPGGSPKEIFFWPRLAGGPDRHWVEPDILILLEESLIVIEVKPPNGGGWQNLNQWQNEIRAAVEEYRNSGIKRLYFIPLGRNCSWSEEDIASAAACAAPFKATIHPLEWKTFAQALENLDAETPQDKRILGDIRLAFELFGVCGEGKRISAEALLTFCKSVKLDFSYVDLLKKHQPSWNGVIAYSKTMPTLSLDTIRQIFFDARNGKP